MKKIFFAFLFAGLLPFAAPAMAEDIGFDVFAAKGTMARCIAVNESGQWFSSWGRSTHQVKQNALRKCRLHDQSQRCVIKSCHRS